MNIENLFQKIYFAKGIFFMLVFFFVSFFVFTDMITTSTYDPGVVTTAIVFLLAGIFMAFKLMPATASKEAVTNFAQRINLGSILFSVSFIGASAFIVNTAFHTDPFNVVGFIIGVAFGISGFLTLHRALTNGAG